MTPRGSDRTRAFLEMDDSVRRALAGWAKERDSDLGRLNLKRAIVRLTPPQRRQLIGRLVEISLGVLFILDQENLQ